MTTDKDLQKETAEDAPTGADDAELAGPNALAKGDPSLDVPAEVLAETAEAMAPNQLGTMRFVYAAYFTGAIAIAFLVWKAATAGWQRLSLWKPQFGEPRDEVVLLLSGAIGVGAAVYYWKKNDTRQYVEEVANELSKVTWPSRAEVTNSTTIVIIATAFATVFFALMDRFWGFVTNLVYGT